jgi:hypothetical protein
MKIRRFMGNRTFGASAEPAPATALDKRRSSDRAWVERGPVARLQKRIAKRLAKKRFAK